MFQCLLSAWIVCFAPIIALKIAERADRIHRRQELRQKALRNKRRTAYNKACNALKYELFTEV